MKLIQKLEAIGFTVERYICLGVYYLTRGDLTVVVLADQNRIHSAYTGEGEDIEDVEIKEIEELIKKNRTMTPQENIISAQIDGGLHEKQALLDDFAKAVMQGIVSSATEMRAHGACYGYEHYPLTTLVKESYDIASAMMQERERRMKG